MVQNFEQSIFLNNKKPFTQIQSEDNIIINMINKLVVKSQQMHHWRFSSDAQFHSI